MKEIICIILIAASFMVVPDAFAASISSQSIDVTVGEVDIISGDSEDEEQNITAPETGFFSPEFRSASVVTAMFFAIPIAVAVVWLSRLINHRYKK